jgi:uncharacterized membrane protein YfcA
MGAGWATRSHPRALYRVLAVLLVAIAMVLLFGHSAAYHDALALTGKTRILLVVVAGFRIGTVAALMGVAGGELLIPTFVLLFGVDVKLAGSLSLAVSLPTMLVGFARCSQDRSFTVLRQNRAFLLFMALGSVLGTFVGGRLVGATSGAILLPVLAAILMLSAIKVWQHR